MNFAKLLFVAAGIFVLQGCTTALLAVGGTAAQAGLFHHMNSIAEQTFANPVAETKAATVATLSRMRVEVRSVEETEMGWQIKGAARGRTITIDLEGITSGATRMEVSANRFLFFMDKATAEAIVAETSGTLTAIARAREQASAIVPSSWRARVALPEQVSARR